MSERANFFDRKAKALPTKEITLPTFGKVVLEKLSYPTTMMYWELSDRKQSFYQSNPFPLIYDDQGNIVEFTISKTWANTAAMLTTLQKRQDWGITEKGIPIDNRYSWEEIIASFVTDVDESELLVSAMNELNATVEDAPDPKAVNSTPEKLSGDSQEPA